MSHDRTIKSYLIPLFGAPVGNDKLNLLLILSYWLFVIFILCFSWVTNLIGKHKTTFTCSLYLHVPSSSLASEAQTAHHNSSPLSSRRPCHSPAVPPTYLRHCRSISSSPSLTFFSFFVPIFSRSKSFACVSQLCLFPIWTYQTPCLCSQNNVIVFLIMYCPQTHDRIMSIISLSYHIFI